MPRSSGARSRGTGFTLVELLITVAIIAVLAGIIYAALGPVRERGRQMVCISNLHRLEMALLAYRMDYGGKLKIGKGTRYRYDQLGLPPLLHLLGEYADCPAADCDEFEKCFHCPNMHDDPPRSYGYAVWRGSEDSYDWPQLIAERGGEFPVFLDPNHGPTEYYRYGRLVIVGRLNGQVQRHYVDPYLPSTAW